MQAGLKEFWRILLNNLQGRCREQKIQTTDCFRLSMRKTHTLETSCYEIDSKLLLRKQSLIKYEFIAPSGSFVFFF